MIADVVAVVIVVKDVLLGMAGGAIAYLFDYSRAKREGNVQFTFMFSSMIINVLLGAFVAYVVGSMIPLDTYGRDAMVGLSGVTAYNIILLAESKFASWLVEKLSKK